MNRDDLERMHAASKQRLLDLRTSQGCWVGELSSSALSTATALCALALFARSCSATNDAGAEADVEYDHDGRDLVAEGVSWLVTHQNDDGGWGDTVESPSNISTTVLSWAAIHSTSLSTPAIVAAVERAERWIVARAGGTTPSHLSKAIEAVYGSDRTFAVPILTMCALTGRLGDGRDAWSCIPTLPFELAACPHRLFRWLGLPVVSYALPALIAIGQARHHHRPTRHPVTRLLRWLTRAYTLRKLRCIQPQSGGFLEATPLTAFVVMSLVSMGRRDDSVVRDGVVFLRKSVRDDGSWPIDTNLSTWVTTLSIHALAGRENSAEVLRRDEADGRREEVEAPPYVADTLGSGADDLDDLIAWLLNQQYLAEHPYTRSPPGGWAWTDLSGGVPDADDTAGALLALHHLTDHHRSPTSVRDAVRQAAAKGAEWLVGLQNRDGGIPTFCRGWGKLPFDRSSPDLTAHAIRAWHVWRNDLPDDLRRRVDVASVKAVRYLLATQDQSGYWVPLWFGNQHAPQQQNPVYGTARVLRIEGVCGLQGGSREQWLASRLRGLRWLLSVQNPDGGWGGGASLSAGVSNPSSIEETALAVESLAFASISADTTPMTDDLSEAIGQAVAAGCDRLAVLTHDATAFAAAPIGLYFARLWYTERLYPLIFTVSALKMVSCTKPIGVPLHMT